MTWTKAPQEICPGGAFSNLLNKKKTLSEAEQGQVEIGSTNNFFAPSVGPVTKTYFYFGQFMATQQYYEERLVAYQIGTP
jgi:hypothetical protein